MKKKFKRKNKQPGCRFPHIPVAYLTGVIETPGSPSACSLIFELETETGHKVILTYGLLMETLRFAQDQAIMPPLSEHWWARIGGTNGCTFQS
ncbi:hypothetical protein RP726_05710 [Candidatus Methylospira mobilis]|uniref:hypothetical protein n=1 Tax=Candidatus Methylospira mobilis TaxID=1808979 RepID=UPI0028EC590C|nr:hypothetical protein [Candidatus Methylospira mobilis]WNV05908.1 hypothetical protein RP726_05710 [Candidatus Methylospira mobilis]